MKVKELIEILQKYDGEMEVLCRDTEKQEYDHIHKEWINKEILSSWDRIDYPPTEPTKYLVIG